jgi:molybdate transport system regulatory protein
MGHGVPVCSIGIAVAGSPSQTHQQSLEKLVAMPFKLRTKMWIADSSGNVIFGMGRVKILEAVEQYGSINAAAKSLKMSYRAVWGRIKATEDRLGRQLVVRTTGGSSGGGSVLTPYAKELVTSFKIFRRKTLDQADNNFAKHLLPKLGDR